MPEKMRKKTGKSQESHMHFMFYNESVNETHRGNGVVCCFLISLNTRVRTIDYSLLTINVSKGPTNEGE
ncbi:hypothetical protein COC69_25900, partial [Bacillus cereus]